MSDQPVNKGRRLAMKLAVGSAVAVPLSALLSSRHALADDLPHLDAANPQAAALQYVEDATKATRADKAGTPGDQQTCKNCQLATSAEGEWLPCQLFSGKAVSAAGWCSAWALRQG